MTAPHEGAPPPIIDNGQLSAYLDGDLSPAAREAVRQAIQSDPAVATRYHELAATVSLLRTLPTPMPRRSFTLTADQLPRPAAVPPTPASENTVLHPVPRPSRLTPLFGTLGAVAAVLLLMLVSADFVTGGFKTTTTPRTSSAYIEQVTAASAPSVVNSVPAAQAAAPRSSNAITAATIPDSTIAAVPSIPASTPRTTPRPVETTTTGLPLALVRAVEVALGISTVAGIVAAIQNSRGRRRAAVHG